MYANIISNYYKLKSGEFMLYTIQTDNSIDIVKLPSENFSERKGCSIKALIVHCVGTPLQGIPKLFKEYGVSAHYIVPQVTAGELQVLMPQEFGEYEFKFPNQIPVIQLVDCSKRAWHAGKSTFGELENNVDCGPRGLNSCSIGIEFHTENYAKDGDMYNFAPFTVQQAKVGIILMKYLVEKYGIEPQNVLAHSTIAVGRKTDPGPLFFWKKLHDEGLGYLPTPKELDEPLDDVAIFIQEKLLDIGFNNCSQSGEFDESTRDHIHAYTMQFAPDLWAGYEDCEATQDLLESLNGFDASIFHSYNDALMA